MTEFDKKMQEVKSKDDYTIKPISQTYENESKMVSFYTNAKSKLSTWLGVILTIVGAFGIFFVASLEGTKEVKASNSDSGKLLREWRKTNEANEDEFPLENVDVINYKDRDYYFVVDSYKMIPLLDENDEVIYDIDGNVVYVETNEIDKWHWAYDGGLEYVFGDYRYYVLTMLAISVSIWVSNINYTYTVRNTMATPDFQQAVNDYEEKKRKVYKYTQYIPDFCTYKNKQAYVNAKRNIVEESGLNWEFYNSNKFKLDELEKWQIKKLNQIKKIKVELISPSDLLQEKGHSSLKITLLPTSSQKHKRKYTIVGSIQRIIQVSLSGIVIAFGIVLGDWYLGMIYAMSIIFSYIGAVVVAIDFTTTTFKNRYIAKGDYLVEFDNIKETFMGKETQLDKTHEVL